MLLPTKPPCQLQAFAFRLGVDLFISCHMLPGGFAVPFIQKHCLSPGWEGAPVDWGPLILRLPWEPVRNTELQYRTQPSLVKGEFAFSKDPGASGASGISEAT